jgi:UDP-glucose 4-epimerase
MKILVTGSQGGIGRWMVKALLEAGHTIRTLDRAAQARENSWEHLPGDVRDLPLVRRAVEGVDAVIHMAAIMADAPGLEDLMLSVNIQGAWNVLISCVESGVPRLVNFSSLQALGHSSPHHTALYLPLDDSVPRQPATTYQISKHVVEEMCQAYAGQHGLVIVSLRPTHVYQPVPEGDQWWHLLEETQAGVATKDYWSFVDVRDVCQAALLSLTAPLAGHQAFLLASDYTHARRSTLELVKKYYPRFPWPKVQPEDYVRDNPYRSLLDCSQAKKVLDWQPNYSQREEILGES